MNEKHLKKYKRYSKKCERCDSICYYAKVPGGRCGYCPNCRKCKYKDKCKFYKEFRVEEIKERI